MIPPEVQLPANWDAPLQNPIPVVPPIPVHPRRGPCRAPLGPLHDISSGQSDPALNTLHRGHIAHREQAANHRAEVEILLQQRDLRGSKDVLRLAKEPTMCIAFIHSLEYNQHYSGVESCFSNMLLMLGLLLSKAS